MYVCVSCVSCVRLGDVTQHIQQHSGHTIHRIDEAETGMKEMIVRRLKQKLKKLEIARQKQKWVMDGRTTTGAGTAGGGLETRQSTHNL